jgi:hypothetical protein
MPYLTSTDVKSYGAIPASDTQDNAELVLLIARAQQYIETYTGRIFMVSSDTESTRYYESSRDVDGLTLYLDNDLNTLGSNGIIAGTDTLASTNFYYEPRNDKPYHAITLRGNAGSVWTNATSDGDYENAIQVHAQWAYSSDVPADIQHALIRLVKWYYKQGRVTDETADRPIVLESGATVLPAEIPSDILAILKKYVYRPVKG